MDYTKLLHRFESGEFKGVDQDLLNLQQRYARYGIEIFEGDCNFNGLPNIMNGTGVLDNIRQMGLWRLLESYKILHRMMNGVSVLIRGYIGSGKGAVLNGIRMFLKRFKVKFK